MATYRPGIRAFIAVLLLAALLASALPTVAQGGVTVIANDNLNLRAAADRNSSSLGTVPYDTELTATAISPDRNWVAVVLNGQGGWLSLAYTGVVSGSLNSLPVSSQVFTAGGGGGVTSAVNVVATINLRYRANPNLDERPLGAIPFQTQVPALAVSADSLFVMVNYLGENVWVYREYVQEVTGSLGSFVPGAPPVTGSAAAPAQPVVPTGDLTVGATANGSVGPGNDSQNFTIYLMAGQRISVVMQATSGDLDCFLSIIGPGGNVLATNDDISSGNFNSAINGFTAPSTGLYTIRASRYHGTYRFPDGHTEIANTGGNFALSVSPA